ncbi:MAG TPA: glycosyltransferase [Mobilitalea sp.]|nr:glycosyltransferase [Mobilitalea sp.]
MKKKILFVNDVLSVGGVERSLVDCLNHLDYERLSVDLYILHPEYDLLDQINKKVKMIYVKEQRCKLSVKYLWLYIWMKLLHVLSFQKAEDGVKVGLRNEYRRNMKKHFFPKYYDYAVAYKHSETAEFVIEVIGAEQKILFYHHGEIMDYELHQRLFQAADKIVAVSDGVAAMLSKAYPAFKDKITVIRNLIDPDVIRRRAKEYKAETVQGKAILCSCGRLHPEKGFDLAVAAAKVLSDRGIDFHWYFVGDGLEHKLLEERIETLGLKGKITITGMLINPNPYLDACDIYVQPSYTEAFCLSIAEAQVLRKPVISTATIGAKQLIEDGITGILTESNGVSIGNAIYQLLMNKDKRLELIDNTGNIDYNKSMLEYHFSWQSIIQ